MPRRAATKIVYCPGRRHSLECTTADADKQAKAWTASGCSSCAAEKAKNTTHQEPTP